MKKNTLNFIGNSPRQAHNSVQLFHYLTNSMTEATHLNIFTESDNYMDNETPVGEFMFKLMMKTSVINTKATYT